MGTFISRCPLWLLRVWGSLENGTESLGWPRWRVGKRALAAAHGVGTPPDAASGPSGRASSQKCLEVEVYGLDILSSPSPGDIRLILLTKREINFFRAHCDRVFVHQLHSGKGQTEGICELSSLKMREAASSLRNNSAVRRMTPLRVWSALSQVC